MPELDLDDDLDLDDTDDSEDDPSTLVRTLRKQLKAAQRKAKESQTSDSELRNVRLELAATKAGLGLSDKQLAALARVHDGEVTADSLRATAVDLGWVTPPELDEQEARQDEQAQQAGKGWQQITDSTRNAAPAKAGVITPEDAAQWTTDRLMRFGEQYPEHSDALLRGETVTGINF